MKNRISRKVGLIGIGMALTLFLGANVLGQVGNGSPTLETRETSNKADQNLKSISRINPSTLAMELDLPLTTYPGRNGNSLPIGFSYSSKIWRIDTGLQWWYWQNTQPRYVTDVYARFAERSAAGWTSNLLSPRIDLDNKLYDGLGRPWEPSITSEAGLNAGWQNSLNGFANNLMEPCGTSCSGYTLLFCGGCNIPGYPPGDAYIFVCTSHATTWCETGGGGGQFPEPPPPTPLFYIKRLHIAMPDGSNHEFRASDTPIACGTNQNVCTPDLTGTYLSVDGTGMRFVRTTSGSTLYLSDGSRYSFTNDALADSYSDKHGNKFSFSRTTNAETHVTTNKWTDTLGREIDDPMPHNWLAQTQIAEKKTVNLPGLNGQTQQYELTWANLKPRGCEADTSSNCIGANNVTGGALEEQTEKLYFETKYFCRGNISDNLVTQWNGEVLFPGPVPPESGIRLCNSFDLQRNANGEVILDANENPIPFAPRFNPVVLSEVELPNGKKYIFKYNRYGEITKITYPTGSYETFAYGYIAPMNGAGSPSYDQTNRGVTEHRIYESNGNLQQMWSYSVNYAWASGGNSTYKITTRGPKANDPLANTILRERNLMSFYSGGDDFGYENVLAGMPIEERSYDENASLRSRVITENITKDVAVNSQIRRRDPRVKRSVTINFEPSSDDALATLTEISYDEGGSTDPEYFSHLNSKQKKSYHYATMPKSNVDDESLSWTTIQGWFPSSKLASVSETDYSYDPNYKARGIASLPIRTRVLNPANPDPNNPLAKTETIYDNALPNSASNYAYSMQTHGTGNSYDCSSTSTPKICWQNPNGASGNIDMSYRGLPTTTRVWNSDNSTWIESHVQHDQFGNAVKARDPVGNETTTVFTSSYKYAYPTQVITPAPDPTNTTGTNQTSTVSTAYDFNTGLPTSVTDDFNQTTEMVYEDPLLRPTKVKPIVVNGVATGPVTETIYGDTPGNLFVKVRKQLDATNWDEATTFMDGLGRSVKTQAKDSHGDVFVETKYDNLGRVAATSNPYRNDDTVYWSKPRYDELNRVVETYAPEAGNPLDPNIHGASLGVTSFGISTVANYVGTVVTTTDASLRKGRSITNALGQLIRVDEPTASGGTVDADLGTLSAPTHPTHYTYSPQGKMVKVQQGAQNRYFLYDSLGRLIRVRQPEQEVNAGLNLSDPVTNNSQWTAGFTYDVLGNILTATDAKGTVITNTYDRANRVKTRSYSDSTSPVSFYYDGKGLAAPQSPNYAKGKLTKVDNGISATENMTFDNFGRLTRSRQITDGVVYGDDAHQMTYQYNLSGALTQETYPSGRVVKNEFESDGDLMRVFGKANVSATERTYANSFSYTASGGISQMRLGNGKWETAKFNNRLQVTELGLGASSVDAGTWKVNYEYGELNTDGSVNTSKNTGNVAKQTLSFNGLASPFVQAYKYDSLYRLTEAKETPSANTTANWIQNWAYDRYGNRTGFTQNIAGNTAVTNPIVDANTNRFVITGTNFQYDLNGNLTRDAEGRQFTFNGDNKQTQVKDINNAVIGTYFYDGEGKRVKKVTNAETTVFVYSSGKLVAEYSTQLSQNPTTSYTTTDHLGSPRVITDQLGQVKSRRDFLPFGEDIYTGVGNRTAALKYGSTPDDIRQKFTGYQKDSETNLDFAEARMYENRHGRFTAVDPLLASGEPTNPQSFNRYIYALNRPLVIVDPTGEFGDYYDRNGNWLRSDGKNDKKVYLSTTGRGWGGPVTVDTLLPVTIEEFRKMANVIRQEGTSQDLREYLWFAHTANNQATAISNKMFNVLMSSWSSVEKVNKTELSDKDKSDRAKFARAGVIDVLSGGKDPTGGARFFDGTDFLAWGLKSRNGTPHNKFEEYSEVVIDRGIYTKFLNSQLSKYPSGTVRYRPNHSFKIPAQVFTDPANWKVSGGGWRAASATFKYTTGKVGRPTLEATGAWGQSIFWKIR